MKHNPSAMFLLITIALLSWSADIKAQQSKNSINRRIDSLVNKAVNMGLFSGDVLIIDHKNIIYDKAFGKADYEKNIPNTLSTQFQIGSITKDFTKVMILQLIEQNRLSFTNTVGKFLTGFSPGLNTVTIRQLLTHRSGLGSYQETTSFGEDMDAVNRIKTISDILPFIQKEKLQFKPGANAQYSNSGYVVLAAIIEKVTGKNYYEVLKKQILDKLKMTHTGFNAYVKPTTDKATGYLSNAVGALQSNTDMHIVGGGDGGIYMTTDNLLAFINSMLFDNRLLSNDSKLFAFTNPFKPASNKTWDNFERSGRIALAGGAPGVSALWSANMLTQKIVIVFSNFYEKTAEDLGMRISAVLDNRPVPPLHQVPSKYLYDVISAKGGKYFEDNYKTEMQNSAMEPGDDMVLLNVGRQFLEHNKIDNAISLYKIYTTAFPKIVVAWNDLGDAYLQKKDKTNAKKCYEQALILRPGNPRANKALDDLK